MARDVELDHRAIQRLLDAPDGPVVKDLERRGVRVERGAKRRCPVDTGRLRASITHAQGKDNRGRYVDVGTDVHYGPHVELGTSRQDPQPYLRPALAEEAAKNG